MPRRADRFGELGRARQHVRQFRRMVADRFDVEEHRAGNVAAAIFRVRVALLCRQKKEPSTTTIAVAQVSASHSVDMSQRLAGDGAGSFSVLNMFVLDRYRAMDNARVIREVHSKGTLTFDLRSSQAAPAGSSRAGTPD